MRAPARRALHRPRLELTRPPFAAEDDNEAKQRLTKESAEREKLEAEERKLAEEEERRLESELNAKAKAEASERMAKEAELRKKRASEREASARKSAAAAPARTSSTPASQPPSPAMLKSSPGPSGGASPGAGPTSPGGFSTGDYDDDDDEDEPLPGDRVRSQIPREDVLEALHAQAKLAAKSKAEAWRGERDAARKEAEAKAAAKASESLRLAKAASELKKQQEEEKKTKAQADAKAKADAIAAMMSKLNEPELNVPEAAEGAFTYAKLKELSTKDAMRDAGILCAPPPAPACALEPRADRALRYAGRRSASGICRRPSSPPSWACPSRSSTRCRAGSRPN